MILLIDFFAALFWILVIVTLDSHHEDKKSLPVILKFFFYGMVSAILAGGIYEVILLPGYEENLPSAIVHMVFVGPIEELSKFIVFFILVKRLKSIKEPRDGVLQAVTVGLAFGIVENLFYGMQYGMEVLLIRSILTLLGHMSYSAFWGFYFSWIEYLHLRTDDGKYPIKMLATSIVITAAVHGLYNSLLDTEAPWLSLIVMGGAVVMAIALYRIMKSNSPFKAEPLRDYRNAIAKLEFALTRNPDSVNLNYRLAQYCLYAGRYEQAKAAAQRAYRLDRGNAMLLAMAGITRAVSDEDTVGAKMLDLAVGLMSKEEQARLIHRITILIRDKAVLSDVLSMMREAQIAGKTSKVARKVARKGVDVAFKDVKPAAGVRRLREKAGVN